MQLKMYVLAIDSKDGEGIEEFACKTMLFDP